MRCAVESREFACLPRLNCFATSNDGLKIPNTAVVAIWKAGAHDPSLSAYQTNACQTVLESRFCSMIVIHAKFVEFRKNEFIFAVFTGYIKQTCALVTKNSQP